MSSTSTPKLYLSESVNESGNTLERLLRRARFMGAMDEVEPSDCPDALPELHVNVNDALSTLHAIHTVLNEGPRHEPHEDCWCSPTIEYKTDYVRVYRHRRIN